MLEGDEEAAEFVTMARPRTILPRILTSRTTARDVLEDIVESTADRVLVCMSL
jgi:hypothetical protein